MKKESGITLIALIITIIVLLILAGVSIGMLTGENGLIEKAKKAVGTYENAEAKEDELEQGLGNLIDEYIEKVGENEGKLVDNISPTIASITSENTDTITDATNIVTIVAEDEQSGIRKIWYRIENVNEDVSVHINNEEIESSWILALEVENKFVKSVSKTINVSIEPLASAYVWILVEDYAGQRTYDSHEIVRETTFTSSIEYWTSNGLRLEQDGEYIKFYGSSTSYRSATSKIAVPIRKESQIRIRVYESKNRR